MNILRYLVGTAIRMPKRTAAMALLVLAALAGTISYTGYLVVGALADWLGTGRALAGLLLGGVLARFPWMVGGRPRIVGLLPGRARRPLIVILLALCLSHFLWRGDYVPAGFTGFTAAFVLAAPWLRRTVFDRIRSSVFGFVGERAGR